MFLTLKYKTKEQHTAYIMITAIPEGENLTNTTYTLYYYASSSRYNQLAQLSGGTTERSMNISNMP